MINKDIVDYIANLARIEISEEEKEYLGGQLAKILEYIDQLNELDVEGVEPTRGAHLQDNILREDVIENSDCQQEILKNAPALENNYFQIPKVIE